MASSTKFWASFQTKKVKFKRRRKIAQRVAASLNDPRVLEKIHHGGTFLVFSAKAEDIAWFVPLQPGDPRKLFSTAGFALKSNYESAQCTWKKGKIQCL